VDVICARPHCQSLAVRTIKLHRADGTFDSIDVCDACAQTLIFVARMRDLPIIDKRRKGTAWL